MFRKIHSNRDPRDTLYSELKKEFRAYTDKGNQLSSDLAAKYPRFLFGSMVLLLIASGTLAVVLHHQMVPQERAKVKREKPVLNTGFENIMAAGAALTQTIHLRRQVDSISAKKFLTKTDSLALMSALDSLQHIRLTLPH